MEKEIIVHFVRTNSFIGKDKTTRYYTVSYIRKDKDFEPKTDFINATEFVQINNKMKDKHLVDVTGIFTLNDHDHLYMCNIK